MESLFCALKDNNADCAACNFSSGYWEADYSDYTIEKYNVDASQNISKKERYFVLENEEAVSAYLKGNWFTGTVWGKIFTYESIRKISFQNRKYGEDGMFMFSYLAQGVRIVMDTDYAGYLYLANDKSVMNNKSKNMEQVMEDTWCSLEDILAICSNRWKNFVPVQKRRIANRIYIYWFNQYSMYVDKYELSWRHVVQLCNKIRDVDGVNVITWSLIQLIRKNGTRNVWLKKLLVCIRSIYRLIRYRHI